MLGLQILERFLPKIIRISRTGGHQKIVHYICLEYFQFIDVLPTIDIAKG